MQSFINDTGRPISQINQYHNFPPLPITVSKKYEQKFKEDVEIEEKNWKRELEIEYKFLPKDMQQFPVLGAFDLIFAGRSRSM